MGVNRIERMHERLTKDERKIFDKMYTAITNSGRIRLDEDMKKSLKDKVVGISETDTVRLQLNDMLTSDILAPVLGYTLSVIAAEASEPNLVISSLYQKINGTPNMPSAFKIFVPGQIPVIEVSNTKPEIPPPGENPTFHQIGGEINLDARKVMAYLQIGDEPIKFNQWDIVAYWLREAGRRLAIHKEKRAYQAFETSGITLFSNIDKEHAIFHKWLSGRDIKGRQNGSLSPRDFFKAYAFMLTEDFTPDTVLLHPYAWQMFMFTPMLREIMMEGGQVTPNYIPQNIRYGNRLEPFGAMGIKGIYGTNEPSPDDWAKIGASLIAASNTPWTLNPLNTEITYKPNWMPNAIRFIISKYVKWSPDALSYLGGAYPTTESNNIWNAHDGSHYYGIKEDGSVVDDPSTETAAVFAPTDVPVTDMIMLDSNATGFLYQQTPVTPVKWQDYLTDMTNLKLQESYGFAVAWQGRGVGQFKAIPIAEQYIADNINSVQMSPII